MSQPVSFGIRDYHPSDLISLYGICLKTGNRGGDATPFFRCPDLLGHYYAAPYAILEPELCRILTCSNRPCGYILGTRDSGKFHTRTEREWFPVLREKYPLQETVAEPESGEPYRDAEIIRLIHQGIPAADDLREFPAHLHIDILPEAQGRGLGRQLMNSFMQRLHHFSVAAVHLIVDKGNQSAHRFYERMGFHRILENESSTVFGLRL